MSNITRIFTSKALTLNQELELDAAASSHLLRVLRLNIGNQVILFNGSGGEYLSTITASSKKIACVTPLEHIPNSTKSVLDITLCQSVAKGDRVDFAVQKSTELGVNAIQLLHTERCQFGLKGGRADKKISHWQKIAISASEQSCRDTIPTLNHPLRLEDFLAQIESGALCIIMDTSSKTPHELPDALDENQKIYILVGPEGGFTKTEIDLAIAKGAIGVNLGSRILRTETAGLALISILQHKYGDFVAV
ncbi:MAG: 16S rRNA (uracil(1498)-N(3))-methyltransferase [Gammaproteobacteria bacterium]|nr:MAG: 16S rRNA (uracil(1498)-N(3))-methyltransferase [Gammaproteobacteria bacterium]